MRSFIIALLILSIIIIMIVCNTLYVTEKTDMMLELCRRLKSDGSPDLTHELMSLWESCRHIISLSVHHSKMEVVENALLSLEAYINEPRDFNAQLAILTRSIRRIADGQHFSLDNIF